VWPCVAASGLVARGGTASTPGPSGANVGEVVGNVYGPETGSTGGCVVSTARLRHLRTSRYSTKPPTMNATSRSTTPSASPPANSVLPPSCSRTRDRAGDELDREGPVPREMCTTARHDGQRVAGTLMRQRESGIAVWDVYARRLYRDRGVQLSPSQNRVVPRGPKGSGYQPGDRSIGAGLVGCPPNARYSVVYGSRARGGPGGPGLKGDAPDQTDPVLTVGGDWSPQRRPLFCSARHRQCSKMLWTPCQITATGTVTNMATTTYRP
jgi:hypothetical protein